MKPTAIEPWFDRFLREHLARHPRAGLPARGSDEGQIVFATWLKLLGQVEGLDYPAATAASERLLAEPASEKKHFTALVGFAKEAIRDRRPPEKRHLDLTSREGAEAASRSCERCGGGGQVVVYHEDPEHRPPSAAAHCVCALGRWMRRWFQESKDHRDLLRRIPDLDDVLRGLGPWRLEPPGSSPQPTFRSSDSPF